MKPIVLASFLALVSLQVWSQDQEPDRVIFQILPGDWGPVVKRWVLAGHDEFNGTSVNQALWADELGARGALDGNSVSYYKEGWNNHEVSNGTLKLIVKDEPGIYLTEPWNDPDDILGDGAPNLRYYNYTSGMMRYRQKIKNGLFFSSIKTTHGRGTWPAFWLYGGGNGNNEEIDFLEAKGERAEQFHIATHHPTGGIAEWINVNGNLADGFNRYGGEWGPNFAFFSFNNSYDFAGDMRTFSRNAHMILSIGVSTPCVCTCCEYPLLCYCCSDNTAFCGASNSATPLSGTMEVDYVRWYAEYNCENNVSLCNYSYNETSSTSFAAQEISLGGANCTFQLNDDEYLTLIYSGSVTFGPGFVASPGSHLATDYVPCYNIGESQGMGLEPGFYAINANEHLEKIYEDPEISPIQDVGFSTIERQQPDFIQHADQTNQECVTIFKSGNLLLISSSSCQNELIDIIYVFSIHGQLLRTFEPPHSSDYQINLDNFVGGIYCVQIVTNANRSIYNKFIN